MKTILQETTAKVAGLSTWKHQDWSDEEDTEIQELLEKKRSSRNCLLAKPDEQAAKAAYKTARTTLQAKLKIYRMIGEQDLLREQSYADMVIFASSMGHRRPSMDPQIRVKPLYTSDKNTLLSDTEAIP